MKLQISLHICPLLLRRFLSVNVLIRIRYVQKEILLVMLLKTNGTDGPSQKLPIHFRSSCVTHLVKGAHRGGSGRYHIVDEEEERVLRPQMDPLPYQEVELADGEVRRNQVLLLVQVSDPRLRGLLDDHLFRAKGTLISFRIYSANVKLSQNQLMRKTNMDAKWICPLCCFCCVENVSQ